MEECGTQHVDGRFKVRLVVRAGNMKGKKSAPTFRNRLLPSVFIVYRSVSLAILLTLIVMLRSAKK